MGVTSMRDIRSDLEERGSIIQEQIKGAQVQFERVMLKLQSERDAKIAELTETLAMIDKLMQFEMGVVDKVVTLTNPQMSHSSLADRIKKSYLLGRRRCRRNRVERFRYSDGL